MNNKKTTFVSSAMIFAVSGIVIKLLGMVYKIVLGRESVLGEAGSPYIGFIYPFYNFILIIAMAGIPSAVAKLVSEHYARGEIQEKETVFKVMRKFMTALGIFLAAVFYFISPYIAKFFDGEVIYTLRSINLAILIIPYMGAYRGYFQGHGNLKPFAGSQIVEQLGKVVFGLLFAYLLLKKGVAFGAAGAMLGVSVGAVFGIILLVLCAKSYKKNNNLPHGENLTFQETLPIIKRILYFAIPITIGASSVPLTNMVDGILIKSRLMEIGFTEDMAVSYYGFHAFYTLSVINFPTILFVSIQVSVLPAVSSLLAVEDHDELGKTIRTALKVMLIVSLACAAGLFALAQPVLMLLWPDAVNMHNVSPDLLRIMSIATIFLSIYMCTSGILQGMSLQIQNALNMFYGALVKAILSYFLLAIPAIGVKGASLSSLVAFMIAAGLNLLTLKKRTHVTFNILSLFIKPFIASIIMGVIVYYMYSFVILVLPNSISTILTVLVGGIIYFILIIQFKMLNKDDLTFIPGKKFLAKFIKE